jgi:hypothetical protein
VRGQVRVLRHADEQRLGRHLGLHQRRGQLQLVARCFLAHDQLEAPVGQQFELAVAVAGDREVDRGSRDDGGDERGHLRRDRARGRRDPGERRGAGALHTNAAVQFVHGRQNGFRVGQYDLAQGGRVAAVAVAAEQRAADAALDALELRGQRRLRDTQCRRRLRDAARLRDRLHQPEVPHLEVHLVIEGPGPST